MRQKEIVQYILCKKENEQIKRFLPVVLFLLIQIYMRNHFQCYPQNHSIILRPILIRHHPIKIFFHSCYMVSIALCYFEQRIKKET